MPNYALQQNAANAYCQIKTLAGAAATIRINSGDTFEIEFSLKHSNSDHGRPFGNSATGSFASRGLIFYNALTARISNSDAVDANFTLTSYTRADYNTFKFVRDGSDDVRCYVNGVQNDTEKSLAGGFVIDQFFRNSETSPTSNNGLEFFKVTINGTLAYHFYDTTGTGLVLAEHVNGTVRADLVGFVDDDSQWSAIVGGATTVNATLATISVSTYTATVVTSSSATIVNATLGTIGVSAFDATIVTEASITTEVLKNNTGTVLASTSGIIANVYDLSTGALVVRKTGLTSDGSGVVTFSDVSLSNGTEYLVTITIATADGVARITAG